MEIVARSIVELFYKTKKMPENIFSVCTESVTFALYSLKKE